MNAATSEPTTALNTNSISQLVDFLSSVPPPLTVALVSLGPYISRIRQTCETISWRSNWYDSWLALAAWWAVCLLADYVLLYLLPVAILFTLSMSRWSAPPRLVPPPVTEHDLQSTITDLTTIHTLIPKSPSFSSLTSTPPKTIARVCIVVYIPYLLLTYLVPLRILLAITGSVIICYRAPWANTIRTTLWRSAWVRWSIYRAQASITGQPLSPRVVSLQPTATSTKPVNSLRFLFTIYENQRWWMGLDWTAALLPGERPSWCSATQDAVSPPNAFALPEDTVVFLADGKGGRVKRTATWRWEETEWKVLIKKDGSGLSRVERPLPVPKEDNVTGNRLFKAAAKMRESASGGSGEGNGNNGNSGTDAQEPSNHENDLSQEESSTDADGWIYGDNKWEGQSEKGGMGKYTRYRRWTRVATLNETVETVEDGEVGILRSPMREPSTAIATAPPPAEVSPTTTDSSSTSANTNSATDPGNDHQHQHRRSGSIDPSPLRQRLKAALAKGSAGSTSIFEHSNN